MRFLELPSFGLSSVANRATLLLSSTKHLLGRIMLQHFPDEGEIEECLRLASREHYQNREIGIPDQLDYLVRRGVSIDFSKLTSGRRKLVQIFYENLDTRDTISQIVTNIPH